MLTNSWLFLWLVPALANVWIMDTTVDVYLILSEYFMQLWFHNCIKQFTWQSILEFMFCI